MSNNIDKNFNYLIPLLFLFPLLKENISTFFFILLTLNTIVSSIKKKTFSFNLNSFFLVLPFCIILIHSLLWFSNADDLKPIKNGLYFLLFPMVFLNIPKGYFTTEKLNFYFEILKNVVFFVSISYFFMFFYFYDFEDLFQYRYNIPKFRDFIYYEVPLFKIHPTYFTSILIFVTAKAAMAIINNRKWINLIYISFFLLTSFALLAKFNIIFIFFMLTFIVLFRTNISKKNRLFVFLILTMCSVLFVNYIPGIKNRFIEIVDSYNNPPKGMAYDSTNIRVAIFNCNKIIAAENFLTGVGFNNLKDELLNCFYSNYDSEFYKNKKYMTHNYYAYIFLSSGIFGLLLFLFYVYKIIVMTIKINSFPLYVVITNVFLVCFIEDFFYRQFGLYYFSLIFYAFYNNYLYKNQN